MDHRFLALTVALTAFCAKPALAGYAQAAPPAGWSPGGGAGGSFTGTKAANSATFLGSTVSTNASLNVAGRTASIPASMRFAANAPRMAAMAIMANPYMRAAATVATWLGLAGLAYDAASGLWSVPDTSAQQSDGQEYFIQYYEHAGYHASPSAACSAALPLVQAAMPTSSVVPTGVTSTQCLYSITNRFGEVSNGANNVFSRGSACPSGWYVTGAGCVQTPQPKTVTPDEAVEEIIKHPMPADLPRHIPTPLPVDPPEIQPVFIPTGDPVPNPSFDPSKAPSPSNPPAAQPGVEVRPAPLPGSPWQVDVVPVNRPIPDPTVVPDRNPVPLPNPNGNGDPPENTPRESDLCEKYPNILACQELNHEEDDTKLPTKAIEFEFNPIPGFQGSKTCPAFPNVGNLLGGKQISWQPFCDSLAKISNLLLAFAWASAAFIMLGYGRSD